MFAIFTSYSRRITTEEKAKVITAVWKTECIQFLAALAIFPRTILKNMMNSSFSFKSSWCNSSHSAKSPSAKDLRGKEFNKFCPLNTGDDIFLFFCLHPSSMIFNKKKSIFNKQKNNFYDSPASRITNAHRYVLAFTVSKLVLVYIGVPFLNSHAILAPHRTGLLAPAPIITGVAGQTDKIRSIFRHQSCDAQDLQ